MEGLLLSFHEKLTDVSHTFFERQLVTKIPTSFDDLIGVNVRF